MDTQDRGASPRVIRLTLLIYGLECGGSGARTVEQALAQVAGVRRAYVNPAVETAYVEYDPALVQPAQLLAAVHQSGYQAGEPRLR